MPDISSLDPIHFFVAPVPGAPPLYMRPYKIGQVKHSGETLLVADSSLKPLIDFNMRLQANFGLGGMDRNAFNGANPINRSLLLDDGRPATVAPVQPRGTSIDILAAGGTSYNNLDSYNVNDTVAGSNWGNIRFRHLKNTAANVLMADGHVETHRLSSDGLHSTLKRLNINVNSK
jgi:prepilin-type processing-associated H-X9-DG protein